MGGPSYPYRGRAIMKYKPPPQPGHSAEQTAQQFAFAKGDTITVTGQADDEGDWLQGEKDGVQGVFPAGFVEPLEEDETASSADAVAEPVPAAASAQPAAHAAPSSPSTVAATPSDPTNVVEAQQDSAPVSPTKQETTLREPESAVEKPTLADVTPKSTDPTNESAEAPTSPTKATAVGESDGTTTKAHPPPPARKPNALASRIAAFNAAASAQAAEPPVPRPKPKQWRPPTVAAAPAPAQPKSATSPRSPTLDLPAAYTTEARSPTTAHIASDAGEEHAAGAERREFSAEDAQESISRGGGSLRDRIKALQGGGAGGLGARVDPSAKPWKKHASTDDSASADSPAAAPATGADADPIESIEPINLQHPEENLRDAVVLDSPPAIEHRTAEEPQTDIPGFEPAEEEDDDAPSAPSVTVASADDTSEPTQTSTTTSTAESAISSTDKSADATEGQRVGLPMPALPKRAAGPRARKAKSPAATVPASANPMENVATSSDSPAAATSAAEESSAGTEKETTLPQDDVLASMGGANKLLADDDEEDQTERSKVPVDDDDFETPAAPPAAPTSRPPVPPTQRSFDEPQLEEGEEEINVAQYSPRHDEVPQRTIAEEAVDALPSTDEPTVEEAAPLSLTSGRPPLPPPFVRQVTEQNDESEEVAAKETDDDEALKVPPARQPPIPTHQPPPGQESITTAAEDAYLNKMPDILTPPEEAADESTAAPELNAPTTETIAQTRHEAGHHPAEMAQPTFGKMEGTATPAVERSPPLLAQRNVAGLSGQVGQPASSHEGSEQAGGAAEVADDDDDEEEEDPEIARRRALAARMAKLGGRGPLMGGPMLGFGGLPPKKPAKKKSTAESADAAAQAPVPRIESQVIDPESSSGHTTPDHPPRRVGGPPIGGFALPGIATARSPQDHDESPEQQEVDCPAEPPKLDKNDKIALSGDELAARSAAATDKAFVIADEKREAEAGEEGATAEAEGTQEEEEAEQEADAPPPRPATRPPTLPPTRSVPPPNDQDVEDTEEAAESQASYVQEQEQHSAEPESYAQADDEPEEQEEGSEQGTAEDDDMPPPPPPPRPAGGHQASMPLSEPEVPTSPPLRAIPATPPTHPAPPPPEIAALERSATLSSQRSASTSGGAASLGGAVSPRQSVDVQFSPSRMQGGAALPGAFLAKDLDLDTALPWWRTPGGVPRSLQGRFDIFVDTSEKSNSERGTIEKEIEVIYSDYSKTLITVSYAADDPAEVSTAVSQVHFPPAMKPNLDALLQWSASLGAQLFAAAHTKMSDKSARGLSDYDLLRFCYGRATDPLLPVGTTFGVKVYEATVEHGQKHPMVGEDDEPRAGDVVSIYAKFKHNLSTKTVGSEAHGPHLGIVAAWEPKKGKLKVIEVEGKHGSVDENSYRVDEMRAGSLIVYRVAPRDFIV